MADLFTRAAAGPGGGAHLEAVAPELSLVLNSYLWSREVSLLRAASQSCRNRFQRHCPVNNATFFFLEVVGAEAITEGVRLRGREVIRENRHPRLRCLKFRVDALLMWDQENQGIWLPGRVGTRPVTISPRPGAVTLLRSPAQRLRSDRSFVMAAVLQNGIALKCADESFKRDRDGVLAAVRQNGEALLYADQSLKRDHDVVIAALRQNGHALLYADASLKMLQRRHLSGRHAKWLGARVRRRELHERQRRRLSGRHAKWLGARVFCRREL